MRATLANALTAPAGNPAVTIMLDQSMTTQEGGKTRLANVAAALDAQMQALPPTSAVGLWTFDGVEGRSEVPTGPLSDPVDGQPRSAALAAALDEQTASGGGAVSFTTLRMIYDDALAKFRAGPDQFGSRDHRRSAHRPEPRRQAVCRTTCAAPSTPPSRWRST